MPSRTKLVSVDKIAKNKDLGTLLIRLMMVVNDCAIADEALSMWRSNSDEDKRQRRQQAMNYFIELQAGHLHEGLALIREIDTKKAFKDLVEKCELPTREQFDRLRQLEPSTDARNTIWAIRNKLSFHYDPRMIADALQTFVRSHPETDAFITIASASENIVFEPGLLIDEHVAIHGVFKIADGDGAEAEAARRMGELSPIMADFMNFASNFVWQHT